MSFLSPSFFSGRRAALSIGALLFVALGLRGLIASPPTVARVVEARLELAAGAVTLGTEKDSRSAITGAVLPIGAELVTAAGARAMARLSDGSALFLRDSTRIQLDETGIRLLEGEIFVEATGAGAEPARHSFGDAVLTGNNAGVAIRHEGARSQVVVTRGAVVVTSPGGRVEARAGEQVVLADGKLTVTPVSWWEDWTGGMADHQGMARAANGAAGQIYGVHLGGRAGEIPVPLEVQRQTVRAVIRSGLAETEVDQVFFNPEQENLEGWFWFTVPEGAMVSSFAVETDGQMVDGEFVEKTKAAKGYATAARSGLEPAILEWVNERTVRARIFPIGAMSSRRVVLRYLERLPVAEGELRYVYPMRSENPPRIGEFSLTVDLGPDGESMSLSTLADARVENGGQQITMRRSGFTPRTDFLMTAIPEELPAPLRAARFSGGGTTADYVMMRYTPDIDWLALPAQDAAVVVVVDTSGGADEAARRLQLSAVEAVLRSLSASDRFAMVSVDVNARALYPAEGLSPAEPAAISAALERLNEHAWGGATDISGSFDVALGLVNDAAQPAVIYLGDGVATSGSRTGEALREDLRHALSTSRARLFTVGIGTDADMVLLGELARAGGGRALRIDDAVDATDRALQLAADVKAPTLTDLKLELGAGLDELFISSGGKIRRGEEVLVLARSHHALPDNVKVTGTLAGGPFTASYEVEADDGLVAMFAPKLWAQASINHLLGGTDDPDDQWGNVSRMGIEYGLLTRYSSILALPNSQAYAQMGIVRSQSTLRGTSLVHLSAVDEARLRGIGLHTLGSFGCSEPLSRSEVSAIALAPAEEQASGGELNTPTTSPELGYYDARADGAPAPPPSVRAAPSPKPDTTGDVRGIESEERAVSQSIVSDRDVGGSAGVVSGLVGGGQGGDVGAAIDGLNRTRGAGGRNLKVEGKTELAAARQEAAPRADKSKGKESSARPQALSCSDISARPVADRVPVWRTRVQNADGGAGLVAVMRTAAASCELGDYRAENAMLSLVVRQLDNAGAVRVVLDGIGDDLALRLARMVLRRTPDAEIVKAAEEYGFQTQVDWIALDRALQGDSDPERRLSRVREAYAAAPDDPRAALRLVRALSDAGHTDELLAKVRELQGRGVVTTEMAREVGDILARAGRKEAAIRAWSEIVEFDPDAPGSRRLLGDLFLAHGWYEEAYRQYESLLLVEESPLHRLRLGMAAAGAGRVDEALRLERAVAATPGAAGANDVRLWGRLWSAARLGTLLNGPAPADVDAASFPDSVRRRMKELQLFASPGTLVLLCWENLNLDLELSPVRGGADPVAGAPIGVSGLMLPPDLAGAPIELNLRSEPRNQSIPVQAHRISWDGSSFRTTSQKLELAPLQTRMLLPAG